MEAVRLSVAVDQALPEALPPAAPAPLDVPGQAAAETEGGRGVPAGAKIPPLESPAPGSRPPGPTPPTAPTPSPPARRGLRGAVARWLGKPAAYARAYLSATLQHQVHLQAERTVAMAGQLDHVAQLTAGRGDAVLDELRALSTLVEEMARRQREDGAFTRRLADRFDPLTDVLTDVMNVMGAVSAQLEVVNARTEALSAKTDALLAVSADLARFGPRFDELEIKARPLLDLDGDSLGVRLADGYILTPRSEPVFALALADATSAGLEPGVRAVIRARLSPGDTAIDVGANVGLHTLAMGRAVGPGGRVFAFEPEDRVRHQLAKTLHVNGQRQVELSAAAAGAAPGRLAFNESPIIGHSSLHALPEGERADARVTEVEVVRLDDVIAAGGVVALVKIDAEGAELDVLAGMPRLLDENPDVTVIAEYGPSHLLRLGIEPAAWFAAFAAHGLKPHLISEPSGAARPTSPEQLAEVESANLAFVRPGGVGEARLPR